VKTERVLPVTPAAQRDYERVLPVTPIAHPDTLSFSA
jgi:hypothetical protein